MSVNIASKSIHLTFGVRQATISFPDNQQLGPKAHMCHVAEMLDFMQATLSQILFLIDFSRQQDYHKAFG
jgi:hypothetical protein